MTPTGGSHGKLHPTTKIVRRKTTGPCSAERTRLDPSRRSTGGDFFAGWIGIASTRKIGVIGCGCIVRRSHCCAAASRPSDPDGARYAGDSRRVTCVRVAGGATHTLGPSKLAFRLRVHSVVGLDYSIRVHTVVGLATDGRHRTAPSVTTAAPATR